MLAVPITTRHDTSLQLSGVAYGGTVISAQSLLAAKYTGWIYVDEVSDLVLQVALTQDTASAVTMVCWSANDNSGANGTGYQVHQLTPTGTSTAPVSTSAQHTWSNPVSAAEEWSWTVFNLPAAWINCLFTGTGAGADDTVTVKAVGVAP